MTSISTLFEVLERHAEVRGGETAYAFLNEDGTQAKSTFRDVYSRALAIADFVASRFQPNTRVVLMYQPGLHFIEAMLACFRAGVIAVPIQAMQNRRAWPRLKAIVEDARCSAILTNRVSWEGAHAMLPQLPALLPEIEWICTDALPDVPASALGKGASRADDIAFLQYTSGTTGTPKGVMVSHRNLLSNQAAIQHAFGHDSSTIGAGWLPPYHDMGLIGNVFQPLYLGVLSVLFSPMDFLVRPAKWLQTISEWRATTSGAPSFAYEMCVERVTDEEMRGVDLSSWTVAFNGAEPVKAHVIDAFARKFRPYGFRAEAFYPCYGMAEATLFITGGTPLEPVKTAIVGADDLAQSVAFAGHGAPLTLVGCGRAASGHEVKIVAPDNRCELPANRIGEIWAAGPSIAQGYWEKRDLTNETFGAYTAEGAGPFLRTGDLGFMADGQLFVTGRLKELIIVRGRNYYPVDIESIVYRSHEALRKGGCAAFGVDGDGTSQLVVVAELTRQYVGKFSDVLNAEIVAKARKEVSDLFGLRIQDLVIIKPHTLPTTSSGKIRRGFCRQLYHAGELERVAVRRQPETAEFDAVPADR